MGNDLPPTPTTVLATSFGDMVCGLTAVAPPTPFIGEVGSAADAAAMGLVTGVLQSAGVPTNPIPVVKVNGRPLGTIIDLATTLPGTVPPAMAQMLVGSGIARIAGEAITQQWGPAHITPTSSMVNLGGIQSVVRLEGTPPTAEDLAMFADPSTLGASVLDTIREAIPSRVGFGEDSLLAEILSGCSMARHMDLAPGEHEVLVGDPVDVVTGAVVIRSTDFEQAVPDLRLLRRYDSRRSGRCTSLGHGWCHAFEQTVYLEAGRVVFRDGDGREKEFDATGLRGQASRPGDVLYDATRRYRLRCVSTLQWELFDGQTTRYFAAIDGELDEERERGTARLIRIADPRSNSVIECAYGNGNLVELHVDGVVVLRFEYGGGGLLKRLYSVVSGGQLLQARFEYSAERDLMRAFDAEGRAREYDYVDHLLIRETNREGGSFRYSYDGVGPRARCVRSWGDGGYLSRSLEHDPQGRVTLVHDSYGQQTIYRYNAAGLVTRIEGPEGGHRTLKYDRKLRLTKSTWADGTTESADYDPKDNLVSRTLRDGSKYELEYAANGRLEAATDAQSGRWLYEHDERGRLRRVQDPAGHSTRFDYDRRGGMCRVTEATGTQLFIRINERGQITEMPRPSGGRVAYSYDERGRLCGARDSDDRSSAWHYDTNGRLLQQDGLGSQTHWERNAEGRVTTVTHGRHRTTIERDAFGLVRGVDLPDARVDYTLDAEGRLLHAGRADEDLLKIERAENGMVEAWEAPQTGRCEVRRQPLSDRITGLSLGERTLNIEWNESGRITAVREDGGDTCQYEYRADGLLLGAKNRHIECTFEREPRGAISEQRWGSVLIEDLHPDHRGRRAGLRLGELRVSYLRSSNGVVEDVAVISGSEVEAGTDLRDRTPVGTATTTTTAATYDPFWRPLSPLGNRHRIWDEERCIVQDDQPQIHHPDEGTVMFVVSADGSVQPVGEDAQPEPKPADAFPVDQAHADAFPAVLPEGASDALPTPSQLLEEVLGYRAWNPEVRPIPGRAPWDPDRWEPRVDSPVPDAGRLDPNTILRALGSPHPPPKLAI